MHVAALGVSVLKGSAPAHPDVLELAPYGPVGDRRFCLVDLDHPGGPRVLRTVENPRLVALRAAEEAGELVVDVPGQGTVRGTVRGGREVVADYWGRDARLTVLDGPWAPALSAYLGRAVAPARAEPRHVVFGGAVTLVTTASLAELARRARADGHDTAPDPDDEAALVADAERFRATAVLATPGAAPFVEDEWVGTALVLGDAADAPVVRVDGPVPRCAVVRLRAGAGTRDPWDPLRLLAADRTRSGEIDFGVRAEVVRPGVLRPGASVATRDADGPEGGH
ncbi:MOSC domain-containing protein [Aquipuribacter nitratireducens]|uniref:MOSC domain-containing protein n=1 Tax=Aquipuribacter nitratireducens TaxID=650104 RepID=A0ABW0GTV6_9MICO